ncbi:hypothetical protein ASPSYDRAFT_94783 [Aspergillus sydowii CBS 593.65]|uniref:Uncharacterized protein n=1 Tax=Aspergillus sydowii CBS 593.65 TaxID=1036612 RepID=A0A1L9T2Q4_9EURO|nr:uncharacterized protein ASPSYDRAFT_94783 [Aspergillus sydowii CBS 593.65]OJJ53583.1 hypothetical protein ASPSYDRAFT_94783 [Aspergillus sydowii CBS 593.65]
MNPANTKPYQLPADATWFDKAAHYFEPGNRLIATAREPSSLSYLDDNNPSILKLAVGVTKPESVDAAFKAAAAHLRGSYYIDVNLHYYQLYLIGN